jgi:CheY-like chemotaxis protein
VEPNSLVRSLIKMLRPLIGEHIRIELNLNESVGHVHADAGHLQQLLMNLCVNARDAMPHGGQLTIKTENVLLTEEYCREYQDIRPGSYLLLTVTDTGCGMSADVCDHIFEPFFTTKGVGRGTGLGLSTCYGIVKQSGGTISVTSEPGQGTVFKVYLPQVLVPDECGAERLDQAESPGGTETILLIEDDQEVRSTLGRMLTRRGYRLLEARDGAAAIAIGAAHEGPIDLILSDVVMPGLSGPEAVRTLESRRGITNVLFMSGFTDHPALGGELLRPGVNCIHKPFSTASVARRIRELLDAGKTITASGAPPFAHA